jgi:hypothetical protein
MISRSDFESIPESASSLDYNPRSRVQGSVFSGSGDPYLRISKDTGEDMIRDGGESEGPAGEDPDALEAQIRQWRNHVKNFATGAGFRKASGKSIDPRKFALHMSHIALKHAQKYGSKSLLKISKRLRWAASQSRKAAEEELQKISNENDDTQEYQVGKSRIEKPVAPPAVPQWKNQREAPQTAPEETQVYPGYTGEPSRDWSWASEGKIGSRRRRADSNGSNSDLIQYALDFLEDYRSTNSLADDQELMDRLNESEVFESWLVDLDSRGVLADPQDIDDAWNEALGNMTSESSELDENLSSDITTSRRHTVEPFMPGPTAPVPGGDPFNAILDTNTHPGFDRFLKKHGSKYTWANDFMEDDHQSSMDQIARRVKSKKKDEEDEDDDDGVMKAVDQCLDHFAGEMVPSEISPEHIKQFIEKDFPGVPWKKVYDAIEEIADPKKRHDKERERTNDEYHASRQVKTTRKHPSRAVTCHYVSAFDTIESTPHRKHAHLQGHREICACCTGTGQEGAGACSRCQGKGRHGLDPDDPQVGAKARVIEKVGSLLLVEINPQQLALKGRQALSRVTGTRVASGSRVRYTHSPELMRFLTSYDVPFKMVGYTHPNY